MSSPSDRDDFLRGLKLAAEEELSMIEASRPEEAGAEPATAWLYDPAEIPADRAALTSLLGAVEELEDHTDVPAIRWTPRALTTYGAITLAKKLVSWRSCR